MTITDSEIFDRLDACGNQPSTLLDRMIGHFRETRQPMELFEALKMRVRHQVGLPVVAGENDELRPDEIERQLELGLLDACREAGTMMIQDGRVREGWMYLRPTGDHQLARQLLSNVEINDDNYDDLVQVLVHEGVDIGRGYQAVLDHQGTCNSITLYEQAVAGRSKQDRQAAASRLLEHLYRELITLVHEDIAHRDAPADEGENLAELITKRPWVLGEGGYHLDTTHLASTVRIASVLDDPELLRKAWELTQYGRRLDSQFQYPGDEPFVDFYPAYAAYYATLLGENVDAGLKLFERKARTVDINQHGTASIEAYVDLLDRVGRPRQAVQAAIELVPDDIPPQRIVPLLLAIAAHADDSGSEIYDLILEYCRRHHDVLGYTAVTHAAMLSAKDQT